MAISLCLCRTEVKLNKIQGTTVKYLLATAEKTTLPDHAFDLAIAGQAWHWFDPKKAICETKRILKPEGSLVIAHYEWVKQNENVAELTETLMKKYNCRPKVSAESGIFEQWASQLIAYDFSIKIEQLDVVEHYTQGEWLGRVRASPVISGVLEPKELAQFDREHEKALKKFPSVLKIPHRCYILKAFLPELALQNDSQDSQNFETKLTK